MNRKLRAVGRALSIVIIAAVTLMISIAAANWIYSTTINIERTETLRIHPASTATISGNTLTVTLEVSHMGTEDSYITKIWINNHQFQPATPQNHIKIGAGEVKIIKITYTLNSLEATVKVYYRNGNLAQDAGEWSTPEGFTLSKPTTLYVKILSEAGTIIKSQINIW